MKLTFLDRIPEKKLRLGLNLGLGVLILALMVMRIVFPEFVRVLFLLLGLLVVDLAGLIYLNQNALKTRQAAFGLNTIVTSVLVLSIVGVLNFMASRYPAKLDLTRKGIHTLSDQTEKMMKGLRYPVRAVFYQKFGAREQVKVLLDNLKALNPKFEVEYVDPDKEPSRAKQAQVRKYGTLQLLVDTGTTPEREVKVEEPNEEKVTNALIKLLKEKAPTVCSVTGHGEKSITATDAEGFDSVRKTLSNQSYDTKEINLALDGKIAPECSAIIILGAQKSFLDAEIKILRQYLKSGGHAVFALDIDIKGSGFAPELVALLKEWSLNLDRAIVIDPVSRLYSVEATVPMVTTYNKEHAITKSMALQTLYPFARPIEAISGGGTNLTHTWLLKSNPQSWAETDLAGLGKGQARRDPSDRGGPITVAMAVEGTLPDAAKDAKKARFVVFGSSLFASNNYVRFGANVDLFANAVSWVMEDDSLISIRSKEEDPGKIELSQRMAAVIFLVTLLLMPLSITTAGIVIWRIRKKL